MPLKQTVRRGPQHREYWPMSVRLPGRHQRSLRRETPTPQVWHTAVEDTFFDLETILIAVDGADQDQSASQCAKAS
jgi:hypothetical protein